MYWFATINATNCIAIGAGRFGFHMQPGDGVTVTFNLLSCVAFNNGLISWGGGIGADGTAHASNTSIINCFNCISVNNDSQTGGRDYVDASDAITWDIHNCIDSDDSMDNVDVDAVTSNGCISNVTVVESDSGAGNYVVFNDLDAPYDLRLQDLGNSKNVAQDMHTEDTGAGMTISGTNDIAGTSRPQNTSYDCGAFEIVAAAVSKVLDLDAILRLTSINTVDLDAILRLVKTEDVDLDAILRLAKSKGVDLDSILRLSKLSTLDLDAILSLAIATQTKTLEVTADVYDMLGWAWGHSDTSFVEIPEKWTVWKAVGGGAATYDTAYGLLQLKSGEVFYSDVKDIGSVLDRLLTIDIDKYGSGSGTQGTIEWRGSTTSFAWDAGSPSWSVYSPGGSVENWRYVQVRVTG
jgi:hypothetical protein